MMNLTDKNAQKVEYGIEIIDNLLMKGLDINKSIYFKEDNAKDLKAACRCCNLPTTVINLQLNRLQLKRQFASDIYVIYHNKIEIPKEILANKELMKQVAVIFNYQSTNLQAVETTKDLLYDSGYLVYQDVSGNYHLYDLVNEQVLNTFEDYYGSVILVKQFENYRNQFNNYLRKNCHELSIA